MIDETEWISPGAFVHWNVDNDDASDNTPGAPQHPGADYLQNGGAVGEDDFELFPVILNPDLSTGKVVITVSAPSCIKMWLKSNNTISLWPLQNNSITFDLSQELDRDKLFKFVDSSYIEGYGSGSNTIDVSYSVPNGQGNDMLVIKKTVKYTTIAANCGNQPRTDDNYCQENRSTRAHFEDTLFGANQRRCEWSVTGPPDAQYNCMAWSVGVQDQFFNTQYIVAHYDVNSNGHFDLEDLDAFYAHYDLEPFTPESAEQGAQEAEVIYYAQDAQYNTLGHAAKRKRCDCGVGQWIMYDSKCGKGARIEHTWDAFAPNLGYGTPQRYYKPRV